MRNAKDKFVRDRLLSSACGGWEGVRRNFVADPTIKYSLKTKDEILQLGQKFELDFKLFGYGFPGPLKEVLENKTGSEEIRI